MATAQELYSTMVRDTIAPHLRALGWKGSGQRYELPDPAAWSQLGFQKSAHNSGTSLRFTINVSVIGKHAWETYREERPELPARPNPSMHYGSGFWQVRIGHLLPARQDTWWQISADSPPERIARVANGVRAAVTDYAMPEIHRRLADEKA